MPREGGGAFAQYLRALFGQKENFNVYFFTSKRGTTIFSSHYNLFLGKQKKNWPGKRALILSDYIGSCSCSLFIP